MTPERAEVLKNNWQTVMNELSGTGAKLLVVSKNQSVDEMRVLYKLGQKDFGENRVQEMEDKDALLKDCPELQWHMIGPLQSNKISKLNKISRLSAIHSVGDFDLAEKLAKNLIGHFEGVGVFLQVNTSHENEKSGFEDYAEVFRTAKSLIDLRNVRFKGLMTMGTIRTTDQVAEAHRCFKDLAEMGANLKKSLDLDSVELSMGMSSDYKIALEHGTSWVRVGSKIFQS